MSDELSREQYKTSYLITKAAELKAAKANYILLCKNEQLEQENKELKATICKIQEVELVQPKRVKP